MSDIIGRLSVHTLVDSGLTIPLTSDFGYGFSQERPIVVHQFGELDAQAEQRACAIVLGLRKFAFRRQHLSMRESMVPDIDHSDRSAMVGGQVCLPCGLSIGDPASDVIIPQDIEGSRSARTPN